MTLLLLLASISWGQSTSTPLGLTDDLKLQNVRKDVREILVGRPTVTGLPTFKNGIKFGDGTTQTTAASAASVTSTTTCTILSYSSFSAITSVTLPGVLASSTNYKASVHVFQNTSNGKPFIRFNGDSGANYRFSGRGLFDQGSDVGNYSNAGTGIDLVGVLATNLAKADTGVDGSFEFATVWGLPKTVKVTNAAFQWTEQSVPADASEVTGGRYIGSANLSSMLIGTSAGTITGYVEIWSCGAWRLQN